ncbi:MAG: alkyl hydroperoxide reductase/thiol specific antioxidant/Mal allergen [Chitinophagaceae bacterium]|nr:alkyl hydroperoxide reductase/thiol specific antioxidant/Mal allergen [Chitinophagaceae bacterium]
MHVMRKIFFLFCLLSSGNLFAQDVQKLITDILFKQSALENISADVHRIDTFTTGDIWDHTGRIQVKLVPADTVLGYYFKGKRDDHKGWSLYSNGIAFDINDSSKTYVTNSRPNDHILGSPGGQMMFTDLFKLDTSKAISFKMDEEPGYYKLRMDYADNDKYQVKERYKIFWIDKQLMLPVKLYDHLVVLNNKQARTVSLANLRVNNQVNQPYDFNDRSFLSSYQPAPPPGKPAYLSLINEEAPQFDLQSFAGERFALNDLKGKVVLLDFWEVWCGPCVEAMPLVDSLSEKYKKQGLLVLGIMNDKSQLQPAKLMAQKNNYSIPLLVGNESLQRNYKINAVPQYVVIGKNGKVVHAQAGYSDKLGKVIEAALKE